MSNEATISYEMKEIDITPFSEIAGEDVVSFVFEHAPRKITTRVAKALEHYTRARMLIDVDEEMGAIRLIAAEEELVVAIFEWLKIKEDKFPEHRDFVRKFKNHVVKLAFYPTLAQFRFILGDMLSQGFTMDGLEEVINWTAKPIIDGNRVQLAIHDNEGKELLRTNPLAVAISRDDIGNDEIAHALLKEFAGLVQRQQKTSLKAFLFERADYRNKLLYASDAGSLAMGDKLADLMSGFRQTYHDLLWTLAVLVGAEPASKRWGLVSQFIALYRLALIEAGILRPDNTVAEPEQ